MKRERATPRSFPADAAEARSPCPCAICGRLTVVVPPRGMRPACTPEHARHAIEAQAGTSRSTVMLRHEPDGSLVLRAYSRDAVRGAVRFVACETTAVSSAVTMCDLTPREARQLAGALLRAAWKAEGRQVEAQA